MRRAILYVCALSVAFGSPNRALGDSMIVKTGQGKVRGKTINNGKVRAYLGLPYAAPPIGDFAMEIAPRRRFAGHSLRDATNYLARAALRMTPFLT